MSTTYPDLTETLFPEQVDTFTRMSDISSDDLVNMKRYQDYLYAGDLTSATNLITANPTLQTKIFNAAKFNRVADATLAVERYFKEQLQSYLNAQLTYIGTYSAATTYKKTNIVNYNGEGFMCRVDSSLGVAPTTGITTTNWALISKQGIQGASGTGLAPRGIWNSSTAYSINDCCAYSNTLWQCKVANTNSAPTTVNTNWASLLSLENMIVSSTQPTNQLAGNLWFQVF